MPNCVMPKRTNNYQSLYIFRGDLKEWRKTVCSFCEGRVGRM